MFHATQNPTHECEAVAWTQKLSMALSKPPTDGWQCANATVDAGCVEDRG